MNHLKSLEKTDERPEGQEARRGGRPPAGTDPQKRRQIVEGASEVFSTLGFDAASMSDVARAAQVSKATLYVYFQDKEHLFTAVCAEKRDRNISEMIATLDTSKPIEEMLHAFGADLLRKISQPVVVAANRIVIGVAERMPDVGNEFFKAGPLRLVDAFAQFLERHHAQGTLKIDDSFLAAVQFLELAQASVFRPRLYALTTEPASEDEIQKVVRSAVRVFLAAYRA
jgi:TetR/AcrR family transcriptional regulator of autoinduction and epiphytic fitness